MDKEGAAELLKVNPQRVRPFSVFDSFNGFNLEGFISSSESRYGCMVITKIDNYLTEQIIIGTPKQKYPFDRKGKFSFPETKEINVYEKYDGTNILAYGYKLKKKTHITYKTRLNPVIGKTVWGDFVGLWKEMINMFPEIPEFSELYINKGLNLSFELWGARNKHLIEYEVPLTVSLLFAIKNDISSPEIVDIEEIDMLGWEIPKAFKETKITSKNDLFSWYQKFRNETEATNKSTEDGYIKGSEGYVWYLRDVNDKIHQFKCKPQSVEEIHWAAGGITKASIWTTIINAYEDHSAVTFEIVKELLLEEFDERSIDAHKSLIELLMKEVKREIDFRNKVLSEYESLDLDFRKNKVEVMRTLSKKFEKVEMKKVFSILDSHLS
jgi:hypothetical protein